MPAPRVAAAAGAGLLREDAAYWGARRALGDGDGDGDGEGFAGCGGVAWARKKGGGKVSIETEEAESWRARDWWAPAGVSWLRD